MEIDKPSGTAKGVAITCLCLSRDRSNPDLVSHDYASLLARLMVATGEMSKLAVWFFQTQFGLSMIRKMFDRSVPGQFREFGKRKIYFETQARNAIAAGVKQILVLGAGYDLLCMRLAHEYPEVKFFEIDHPATAHAKKRGLESLGMPENLRQISVDLAVTPLQEVLREEPLWDESFCSFVIAEGLLQYLREQVVRDLFKTVDSRTGPASRFGFTFVGWREEEGRPEAGPYTDKFLANVEARSEPWLWGILASRLPEFLEGTPWKLLKDVEVAGIEYFACVEKL